MEESYCRDFQLYVAQLHLAGGENRAHIQRKHGQKQGNCRQYSRSKRGKNIFPKSEILKIFSRNE